DQFARRLVARKMPFVADRLANLAVQRLDGVSRVDDLPDLRGEREERDDLRPAAAPARDDGGVLLAPRSGFELGQCLLGSLGADSAVDGAERLGQHLALLPGGKLQRVADEVDDTGLDHTIRKRAGNGLREV